MSLVKSLLPDIHFQIFSFLSNKFRKNLAEGCQNLMDVVKKLEKTDAAKEAHDHDSSSCDIAHHFDPVTGKLTGLRADHVIELHLPLKERLHLLVQILEKFPNMRLSFKTNETLLSEFCADLTDHQKILFCNRIAVMKLGTLSEVPPHYEMLPNLTDLKLANYGPALERREVQKILQSFPKLTKLRITVNEYESPLWSAQQNFTELEIRIDGRKEEQVDPRPIIQFMESKGRLLKRLDLEDETLEVECHPPVNFYEIVMANSPHLKYVKIHYFLSSYTLKYEHHQLEVRWFNPASLKPLLMFLPAVRTIEIDACEDRPNFYLDIPVWIQELKDFAVKKKRRMIFADIKLPFEAEHESNDHNLRLSIGKGWTY